MGAREIKPTSANMSIVFLVLSMALAVMSLFILTPLVGEMRVAIDSGSWEETNGIISNSFLVRCGKFGTWSAPSVRYQYFIQQSSYFGTTIEYGTDHCTPDGDAAAFLKKYTVGSAIKVFYNPKMVQQAVLIKGANNESSTLILLCSWSLCLLASVTGIVMTLLRMTRLKTGAGGSSGSQAP